MPLARRLLLGIAAATALFVLWLFAVWPPPVWYRTHFPAATAFMRMREGAGPGTSRLAAAVPLDSVAPAFLRAVLIGEDHRFWSHGGIDVVAMRRVFWLRRWHDKLAHLRGTRSASSRRRSLPTGWRPRSASDASSSST